MASDFKRVLGRWDIFTLSFGAMIGWSWVVLTGEWINTAGTLGAILAFLIGGAVVAFVGLTYSELTSAMPKVGGEHIFSYKALGVHASFFCTWGIVLGYVSVCAFEAVALPVVVENLFSLSSGTILWHINDNPIYLDWVLIGAVGSVLIGIANYFGVKTAALVQSLFTAMIVLAGVMLIAGSFAIDAPSDSNPIVWNTDGISVELLAVLVMTPFMFVGFDVIPQAAEEINLPFRQIGKVLIWSVLLAILWYTLIIFAVGSVLNSAELEQETLAPAVAMQKIYGGAWAKNLLIFAGLAGIITSWNSFFVGATRAIFAMGHSGMLPKKFGKLHSRYNSPVLAIVLVTFTSVLATFFGKEIMGWLVNAGGLGIVISWSMVALSFLVLRKRAVNMPRPFKVSMGKLVGGAAFILSIGLIFLYLPGNSSSLNGIEWAIVAGWFIFGMLAYGLSLRKYGSKSMKQKMDAHLNEE
ncbi:MAG: APC family permease [Saprospiraceae bacterium]|nr:APC family permease [Saprospiraceae bacterium]